MEQEQLYIPRARIATDETVYAKIGKRNTVHDTAIICKGASIGEGNFIGAYTFIGPNVVIGHNNRIEGHISIGKPAEHRDFFTRYGEVVIGNENTIREFTTINAGTKGVTRMGDRCIMLRGSHLSHDSILEDDVTLSCNVLIGGESHIMKGANMALGSICHQRTVIGSWSMVGMGAVITKKTKVTPGDIFVGNPAKYLKNNAVGLQRANVTCEQLNQELTRFRMLRDRI